MPIYEYVCESCGHEFEEFSPTMSDAALANCTKCEQRKARRKLSVFAARVGASRTNATGGSSPCGRCGDPNGPCSN